MAGALLCSAPWDVRVLDWAARWLLPCFVLPPRDIGGLGLGGQVAGALLHAAPRVFGDLILVAMEWTQAQGLFQQTSSRPGCFMLLISKISGWQVGIKSFQLSGGYQQSHGPQIRRMKEAQGVGNSRISCLVGHQVSRTG